MRSHVVIGGILAVCLLFGALVFYRTTESHYLQGTFGGVSLKVEVADTEAARERGLGGRTVIPDNYGMLFVFKTPEKYGFWMKDMEAPIDMFWLDSAGVVVSEKENVRPASYPTVFYPEEPALYVLETRAGFAHDHLIATGTPLELQKFPTVSK